MFQLPNLILLKHEVKPFRMAGFHKCSLRKSSRPCSYIETSDDQTHIWLWTIRLIDDQYLNFHPLPTFEERLELSHLKQLFYMQSLNSNTSQWRNRDWKPCDHPSKWLQPSHETVQVRMWFQIHCFNKFQPNIKQISLVNQFILIQKC